MSELGKNTTTTRRQGMSNKSPRDDMQSLVGSAKQRRKSIDLTPRTRGEAPIPPAKPEPAHSQQQESSPEEPSTRRRSKGVYTPCQSGKLCESLLTQVKHGLATTTSLLHRLRRLQ
ncbi:hypothetical protein M1146_05230 [Patescibacteria group bacterium]|nr:hypothetical protein [Patescibacteria group bacterium]